MEYPIHSLHTSDLRFPSLLKEIPDAPKKLYYRGELPPRETKSLAVVGSRDYTNYGRQVVDYLISGLRNYPISIISGLALGIDSLAHDAALSAGLYTLAVPGSGIDDSVLYPRRHVGLARRILESGGGLLSEFEPTMEAAAWSFPQRNRIMAGLSVAVLVIEATERSGTLITARLSTEYDRELLVVPGNIFSAGAEGPHQFLKLGATPVTTPHDILDVLGIDHSQRTSHTPTLNLSEPEQNVLSLLSEPRERNELIRNLKVTTEEASVLLMHMELQGLIKEHNGIFYTQ